MCIKVLHKKYLAIRKFKNRLFLNFHLPRICKFEDI